MTKEGCIINPATGRAVKIDGRLGKKISEDVKKKEKSDAASKIKAAAKRAITKKPEQKPKPPKPAKKFGFEDLPADVKGLITGVVKKNKNRKDMIKDAKEKLKGYKLPGYTKMTNEELYDWVYGGKLDKAVAELDKKNAEKEKLIKEEKKKKKIYGLFRGAKYAPYNGTPFEQEVIELTGGRYLNFESIYDEERNDFLSQIRDDIYDGEKFIEYYRKYAFELKVAPFRDNEPYYSFLTLFHKEDFGKNTYFMRRWRVKPKIPTELSRELNGIKTIGRDYGGELYNFLITNGFQLNNDNTIDYLEFK